VTDNPRKHEPPPEPDAGAARPEPVEGRAPEPTLEEQLARAREDAQKYLGNWQRAEADFQNYKRRVEQERDENRRFASAALIMNTLPILDDLERALMSVDAHLAGLTWLDGIRLIYRKLQLILENAGVSAIEVEGQQFDPRYHEAVMHAEGPEGLVLAEVQRGYKLHDRVLRPAMVVVGRGAAQEQGTGNKEQAAGTGEEGEGGGSGENGGGGEQSA
jgi:molecular chaperone GrpE